MAALSNYEVEPLEFGWTSTEFARFYEAYYEVVFHKVRGIVAAADVEDVVQETFLRLYRKRHTFRGETSLRGWVGRVARNSALMHVRLSRVRHERVTGSEVIRAVVDRDSPSPEREEELDARRSVERLRELIPDLDGEKQILVEMRAEERSIREIATALDVSIAAVKSRLYRVRGELREAMDEPVIP